MTILLPEAEVGEGSEWAEAEGALTPKTSQNEIPKNPEWDTEPLTSNKIISLGDLHAMQKLRAAESSYLAGR